jgi:hypothetical protein
VLLDFFRRGRADGKTFESGVDLALRRLLASPKFVFRVERDPAGVAPGAVYALTDAELASRLSFFLWSSLPDDELLTLASRGRLHEPATLERQVRRCSPTRRRRRSSDNFVGQWLQLRNLRNKQPNSHEFPDFDDNLRRALDTELEMFFASILREDHNVLDLMTADYTFVNERLAKHYRIPNVYGSHFRRITLTDDARKGLLGKGAILMVTSHAHRTSPCCAASGCSRTCSARRRRPRPTWCRRSTRRPAPPSRRACASAWRITAATRRAPAATA